MWGKPWAPEVSASPSTVSRRPLTLRLPRLEWIRFSSRAKNVPSRKKLPSNVKENGIVGNPAGPTTAPGGSVTVAAWLAAAGDAPDAPGAPEAPDPLDAPDPPEAPDPLEPLAGAGVADAAPLPEFSSLMLRKST